MEKDFDHIAKKYDQDFTNSEIGKKQRTSVYRYLQNRTVTNTHLNDIVQKVLEINCGTGEDAVWFAKKGYTVLATDISSEMIQVAKKKATKVKHLKFQKLDIKDLNNAKLLDDKPKTDDQKSITNNNFDLIFSNFGGLNCLNKDELSIFFKNTSKLIHKNGKLILVIMPKNTLWERVYFILKAQFKNAFRRNTNNGIRVNVDNKTVLTWYFNPKDIIKISSTYFKIVKTKPIGFFIPPSYLENYFRNHKRLLRTLDKLENMVNQFGFLSRFSDHYLIELEPKKEQRN